LSIDLEAQESLLPPSLKDRFCALAESIGNPIVVSASWAASGALFGLAVALILQRSAPAALLTVAVVGALSWLARGVGNLVLASAGVIVSIAVAYQAVHVVFPGEPWSFSWLGPCALVGLILLLVLGRRLDMRPAFERSVASVEFLAAATALIIALRVAMRVSHAGGNSAGLFLLSSEDNDAWINLVGTMHNSHGVAQLMGSPTLGVFGSVIATYLTAVSAASSGIFPTTLPLSASSQVVFSAYCLLFAAAPIVVALLVRRLFHLRSMLVALLAWGCATTLVITSFVIWMAYGSLSAAVTIFLILLAAYVLSVRPRLTDGKTQVAWLLCVLLVFGAGAAWVGLFPLAGAAIVVCCFPLLGFAARDLRRNLPVVAALLVPAVVMDLELLQQYRSTIGPVGGSRGLLGQAETLISGAKPLFLAGGATPSVTDATQALILVFLVAVALLASTRTRLGGFVSGRGYGASLGWLAAFTVVLLLIAARLIGPTSVYGPTKLQYILAAVMVVLGFVELISRLELGNRQVHVAAVVVVAVFWASTIQNGPMYDAATRRWPSPQPRTVWYDTVEREVKLGQRVLCLPANNPNQNPNDLDPYNCSRFASSLQGKDDGPALTWRFVALTRLPVSDAVSAVENAKDKPWRIVVIGSMAQLRDPNAWWAPIVKLPGLEFVPVFR
jgi:hypothetical protein